MDPELPTDVLDGGRYELDEVLGSGGMGVVIRARDTVLQRPVAIKLLGEDATDPDGRIRFEREARATARLSHPNVVSVFDVGEHDGRPFLVMELLEGPTLAERLDEEGPLPPDEVAAIARDAFAGVAAAHAAGVLHRDLKPGNLMQDGEGRLRVTDFGIAWAGDHDRLTSTGLVLGTLGYLAPERRHGADATSQSDLYALAATLFHLLTGEVPDGRPGDGDLPSGTPAGLRRLLTTCLADDPDHRPASAAAARDLLDAAGTDELPATAPLPVAGETQPVRAARPADAARESDPPPGAPTAAGPRIPDWVPWTLGAAALTVLLLLLVLLLLPDSGTGVEITEDPAETARNLAEWLRARGR